MPRSRHAHCAESSFHYSPTRQCRYTISPRRAPMRMARMVLRGPMRTRRSKGRLRLHYCRSRPSDRGPQRVGSGSSGHPDPPSTVSLERLRMRYVSFSDCSSQWKWLDLSTKNRPEADAGEPLRSSQAPRSERCSLELRLDAFLVHGDVADLVDCQAA